MNATLAAEFETSGDALSAIAAREPRKAAFVFSDKTLTFGDWDRDATAIARGLLERGFRPGDAIALLAQNSVEWPVVQLAVAKAGMTLVPLNTYYKEDDIRYVLNQSKARALILRRNFRTNAFLTMARNIFDDVPGCRSLIVIDGGEDDCTALSDLVSAGASSDRRLPSVRGIDAATIIYTSGTTGFPKGAVLDHRSVMANGRLVFARLGIAADDRITSIVPMFHSASFCVGVSGALQCGATFIGLEAFDAIEMLRTIAEQKATVHIGVPTSYHAMLSHPQRALYDLSSLRVGTCGGADIDPDLLRQCAETFPLPGLVQVYGLTEAAALVTCPALYEDDRLTTAGRPLPGYRVRICDPQTQDVLPSGVIGEVQVDTEYRMRGYFDGDQATKETMTQDGWLKTGDLGLIDVNGRLVLSGGRMKDMIIRGGENIYPAEIERILSMHPAGVEAAVFGIRDDYFGEVVGVAVRDGSITRAEIETFCLSRMAKYKIPSRYFRVEAFPLTPSGKIQKMRLKQMAVDGSMPELQ